MHQAIALGEIAHRETARAALTEACLLCAIARGLCKTWAEACPAPRSAPELGREVSVPAPLAARCAGRSSRRKAGDGLRSARVLGAWGSRVEGIAPAQGVSRRGTSDATRLRGDVGRKRVVQMAHKGDVRPRTPRPPPEPSVAVTVRARAARRAVTPAVEAAAAAARAHQVAAHCVRWDTQPRGVSLVQSARLGRGRRRPRRETTPGEGP